MDGITDSSTSSTTSSGPSSLPTFTAHIQSDPTRSPAWRWDRAFDRIFCDLTFTSTRDDEATGRTVNFRRALASCRTSAQREELRANDPVMFIAYELFESTSRMRFEVEARLLAKQTIAEVAHCVGLPEDVVQVYEAVFFNVVSFLNATGWIIGKAVGVGPYTVMNVAEFGRFIKSVAFQAGPVALDALLSTVVGDDGLFTTAKVADLSTAEGRNAARMALLVLAHFSDLRREIIDDMCRIRADIDRHERESDAERRNEDEIEHATKQIVRPSAPDSSCFSASSGEVTDYHPNAIPPKATNRVA